MADLSVAISETKVCKKCLIEKPLSSFWANKATKDGRLTHCIECGKEHQTKYRKDNQDVVRERDRAAAKKRREGFEYRLKLLLNASKQRSKLKQREHTITLEDIKELYPPDGKCPVFGFDLVFNSEGFRETSPSIDRIDSSKGYTKDNIQIISWKANRLKAYATVEDLELLIAFMKQGE